MELAGGREPAGIEDVFFFSLFFSFNSSIFLFFLISIVLFHCFLQVCCWTFSGLRVEDLRTFLERSSYGGGGGAFFAAPLLAKAQEFSEEVHSRAIGDRETGVRLNVATGAGPVKGSVGGQYYRGRNSY